MMIQRLHRRRRLQASPSYLSTLHHQAGCCISDLSERDEVAQVSEEGFVSVATTT